MSWFWDCSGLGRGIFVGVLVVVCCFLWLGYCFCALQCVVLLQVWVFVYLVFWCFILTVAVCFCWVPVCF